MKIAELFVRLSADTSGLKRGLAGAESSVDRFGKTAQRVGLLLGAGLFAGIVKNSIEAQNAIAQLNAVVKSTGGAAGFTTPQLAAMAGELQKVSTFSDEAIMGAQGLLLTFTKIRGAELQGATQAVMDLAQAMGGDLKGAAIQVGKALNDPKVGLTALRRVGVSFSEAQVAVIKRLQETGQMAEAQKLILQELQVEFGGSAAAARHTLGGALIALKNAFGDTLEVSQESTTGIVGALNTITDAMPGIRSGFSSFFGGVELMFVDLAIKWQENFLRMREVAATFLAFVGGSFSKSLVPKIRQWGQGMLEQAAELRAGVDMTRSSLEDWRAEQYNLIVGLGATVAPLKTVKTGTDELTTSITATTKAAKGLIAELAGIQDSGAPTKADLAADLAKEVGISFNGREEKGKLGEIPPALETVASRLAQGLGDVGTTLINGLAGVANAMLLGGKGRGSQIGGGLGGAAGGALGGMMLGGKLGAFGGPIGMAVGSVIGTLGGSLFGGLFDKKKKVAKGLDLMAAGLNRVNEALRNTPSGYRVRLATFEATKPPPPPPLPEGPRAGPEGPGGTGGGRPGGGAPTFYIAELSVLANDATSLVREIGRAAQQEAARGGTSRLALAVGG